MSTAADSTSTLDTSETGCLRRLFDNVYQDLDTLLADLPNEALVWMPFENSPWQGQCNPLGKIVAHAVSSTVYLLRCADYSMGRCEWSAVGGDEGREEFGPANHEIEYLRARAKRTQEFVHNWLDGVSSEELGASRAHPKRPITFVARQELLHALDHLSQHIGHGQITRQLWAIEAARQIIS